MIFFTSYLDKKWGERSKYMMWHHLSFIFQQVSLIWLEQLFTWLVRSDSSRLCRLHSRLCGHSSCMCGFLPVWLLALFGPCPIGLGKKKRKSLFHLPRTSIIKWRNVHLQELWLMQSNFVIGKTFEINLYLRNNKRN